MFEFIAPEEVLDIALYLPRHRWRRVLCSERVRVPFWLAFTADAQHPPPA
jgi:hypothetical protein